MTTRPIHRRGGFALLEVLLAVAVFSMAATGFVVALHKTGEVAAATQREMKITRVLESALHEALSLPTLEEGKTTLELEDSGMEIDTLIEPIEIENQDGQLLQEMFRIEVTVFWIEDDEWQERSAETWRYGRLYQP
jgi:prepilin-type N-terminal cleavage/methylation domain-containing protein